MELIVITRTDGPYIFTKGERKILGCLLYHYPHAVRIASSRLITGLSEDGFDCITGRLALAGIVRIILINDITCIEFASKDTITVAKIRDALK
jgi:hypothetical protein